MAFTTSIGKNEMDNRNEVIESLKKARALITKPENWTQFDYERDANGFSTSLSYSGDACSFCAVGAIRYVSGHGDIPDIARAELAKTTMELDRKWVAPYNDTHTHAEVLAAFDATIARLETQAY